MKSGLPSIRAQMEVQILVGTAVLLILAAVFMGVIFQQRIADDFDDSIEARSEALESLIELELELLEFEFNEDTMPGFSVIEPDDDEDDIDDQGFFELTLTDGRSLRGSPSLQDGKLPRSYPEEEEPGEPVFFDHELPNGRPGRFLALEFSPAVEHEEEEEPEDHALEAEYINLPKDVDLENLRLILILGVNREEYLDTLTMMYASLTIMVIVVLGGIAIVMRRAFRKGFEPVRELNQQLRSIGPDRMEGRISLPAPREELATIEASVNHLLKRVAAGFDRERRFSSNVAHELRTPISELRSACEVAQSWPDDPEAVKEFFGDIREVGLHMERVVETLLTMARCESGTIDINVDTVPLQPILETCWRRMQEEAKPKDINMIFDLEDSLTVTSDPAKLQMVLQNLIENAVAHGVPGTEIHCSAKKTPEGIDIRLSNQTVKLKREDLPFLFERCWQKDPTASDQRRTGLGLSIAKVILNLLKVHIETELDDDGTFHVKLSLPERI